MRGYLTFTLLVLCLVSIVLAWFSVQRLNDFKAYHQAIAEESTQDIAAEVARYIDDKKRLVKLFVEEHTRLINELAASPEDNRTLETLEQHLAGYFPDYFGFTITDPKGSPFIEDFDGFVGDVCLTDIARYVESNSQQTRIHPNAFVYHFDVMTRLGHAAEEKIILVSFHADILGGLIKNAQTPGHQLMLVTPEGGQLIEVTSDGPRVNWMRDDYRLTAAEKSRILDSKPVQGTGWDAINLRLPGLYEAYRKQLTRESLVIFLLFMAIGFIMLIYVNREENLRRDAEHDKAEFLAGISRDLQPPLEGLASSLADLHRRVADSRDAKTQTLTASAMANCQQLELLTRDLVEFENMRSGRLVFDRQPVEFSALLRHCVETIAAQPGGARITVGELPAGVTVLVDAKRICQVINRLLAGSGLQENAAAALAIEARVRGEALRVSLSEQASGTAPGQGLLEWVVQRGRRDTSLPEDDNLGMSVVRYIIERHGGTMGLTMNTNTGPKFYFELPIHRQAR